jgi:glycosyltransferase involved in cell wall biosynthesis
MNYLIFCSFEVGGLPYRFAELLNKYGVQTYYISIDKPYHKHDSKAFHYGAEETEKWDLSSLFEKNIDNMDLLVNKLYNIRQRLDIKGCFATGSKAFLLDRAGIPYIYWSFGADLDYLYSPNLFLRARSVFKKYYYRFFRKPLLSDEMLDTLDAAKKLAISPYQKASLNRLGLSKQLFFLPHVYSNIDDFSSIIKQKEIFKKSFSKEFGTDYFFFSSVRHVWKNRNNLTGDNKNNDIAIKAFSLYLKKVNGDNCKLVLVNKGCDMRATKEMIDSLSLREYVIWIEEIKREELFKYYMGSELCLGHFGTPVVTNAALEPLSCATPCISYYGQDVKGVPFYDEYPPLYNSNDPAEISDFMFKVNRDKEFAGQLRYKSWDWTRRFCSEKTFINSFVKFFE